MVDYNEFAETFSKSRKNLKWPEIDYFIDFIPWIFNQKISILDVGCGSWRLLKYLKESKPDFSYLWIDSSIGMVDEAKGEFPYNDFQVLDMLNIDKVWQKFDIIFFIASFHHLESLEDRMEVLIRVKNLLNFGWLIMMTNWNLLWENNFKKYENSYLWNWDFSIKIGKSARYYHWFETTELKKLFVSNGFEIIKNEVFWEGNNIVSIIT